VLHSAALHRPRPVADLRCQPTSLEALAVDSYPTRPHHGQGSPKKCQRMRQPTRRMRKGASLWCRNTALLSTVDRLWHLLERERSAKCDQNSKHVSFRRTPFGEAYRCTYGLAILSGDPAPIRQKFGRNPINAICQISSPVFTFYSMPEIEGLGRFRAWRLSAVKGRNAA